MMMIPKWFPSPQLLRLHPPFVAVFQPGCRSYSFNVAMQTHQNLTLPTIKVLKFSTFCKVQIHQSTTLPSLGPQERGLVVRLQISPIPGQIKMESTIQHQAFKAQNQPILCKIVPYCRHLVLSSVSMVTEEQDVSRTGRSFGQLPRRATLSITMMIYLATLSMTMMNYLATLSSSSFRSFILRSKSGSFLSMRSSRDPIILNNIDHKKMIAAVIHLNSPFTRFSVWSISPPEFEADP